MTGKVKLVSITSVAFGACFVFSGMAWAADGGSSGVSQTSGSEVSVNTHSTSSSSTDSNGALGSDGSNTTVEITGQSSSQVALPAISNDKPASPVANTGQPTDGAGTAADQPGIQTSPDRAGNTASDPLPAPVSPQTVSAALLQNEHGKPLSPGKITKERVQLPLSSSVKQDSLSTEVAIPPVNPVKHPSDAPPAGAGAFEQLSHLLRRITLPVLSGDSVNFPAVLWSKTTVYTPGLLGLIAIVIIGLFVLQLRRSGYAHAARSDMTGLFLSFATPRRVSFAPAYSHSEGSLFGAITRQGLDL